MNKTYSVTLQSSDGAWVTNWDKYFALEEIDWLEVARYCQERGCRAFGYQFGCRSNEQTSARTRIVLSNVPGSWQ